LLNFVIAAGTVLFYFSDSVHTVQPGSADNAKQSPLSLFLNLLLWSRVTSDGVDSIGSKKTINYSNNHESHNHGVMVHSKDDPHSIPRAVCYVAYCFSKLREKHLFQKKNQ
jgi:hypothetical protein